MKNFKKQIKLVTACIAIISFSIVGAKAQDMSALKDKTPEQRAQMQTTLMKTKLQLDSVQSGKVQAINLKYAQKLDPVLKGDGTKFKRMREAMSIQKDKDAELKKVFTADQYKQYQAFEDELKEKLRDRMKS
jgi:hypothetical protein